MTHPDDLIERAEYIVSLHNQCRCKWSQTMAELIAALKEAESRAARLAFNHVRMVVGGRR